MDARRTHAAMPTDAGRKVDGRVSASATVRLDVSEGKTGLCSVVLDMESTGGFAILSGTDEVVSMPGTLTFTTVTWATAQIVMVVAVEDRDAQDDQITLGHTIDGYGAEGRPSGRLRG